jgi:hypothetical protein
MRWSWNSSKARLWRTGSGGNCLTYTSPGPSKVFSLRMNASTRPSGESLGGTAESAKFVTCVYASRGNPESGVGLISSHPAPPARTAPTAAAAVHFQRCESDLTFALRPRESPELQDVRRAANPPPDRAWTDSGRLDSSPALSRRPGAAGGMSSLSGGGAA